MGRKQAKRTADFYPKFTIALFTFIISFNIVAILTGKVTNGGNFVTVA